MEKRIPRALSPTSHKSHWPGGKIFNSNSPEPSNSFAGYSDGLCAAAFARLHHSLGVVEPGATTRSEWRTSAAWRELQQRRRRPGGRLLLDDLRSSRSAPRSRPVWTGLDNTRLCPHLAPPGSSSLKLAVPPISWRLSGDPALRIWLGRANLVLRPSVYGTEGQRFESSRRREATVRELVQNRCLEGSSPPAPSRVRWRTSSDSLLSNEQRGVAKCPDARC
jgi:hypothetical protein